MGRRLVKLAAEIVAILGVALLLTLLSSVTSWGDVGSCWWAAFLLISAVVTTAWLAERSQPAYPLVFDYCVGLALRSMAVIAFWMTTAGSGVASADARWFAASILLLYITAVFTHVARVCWSPPEPPRAGVQRLAT